MTPEQLLQSRVLDGLAPLVGSTLTRVHYRCLNGEAEASDINAPDFYLGGEVELVHALGLSPLRITWDENAGFSEHFSVRATAESPFLPDTLDAFDASACEVWRLHIKQPIDHTSVYGLDAVPYVIVLGFSTGSVSVGSSCRTRFGDGNDVFIEPFDLHSHAMNGLTQMWEST